MAISRNVFNSNVLESISAKARESYESNKISGIAASGGDVCAAVLEALDLVMIDLNREVLPGIPAGQAIGHNKRRITVITKSGGFGNDDALVRILEYMR